MSDEKIFKNIEKTEEEKILYGVSQIACFACGEKIERNTDICPYCKTSIK
jgi:hypothetical protein